MMMKTAIISLAALGAAAEGTNSVCLAGNYFTELDGMSAVTSYNGNTGIASSCAMYKVCMTESVILTTPFAIPLIPTLSVTAPTETITLDRPGPPVVIHGTTSPGTIETTVVHVTGSTSVGITTSTGTIGTTASTTEPTHTTTVTPVAGASTTTFDFGLGFVALVATISMVAAGAFVI